MASLYQLGKHTVLWHPVQWQQFMFECTVEIVNHYFKVAPVNIPKIIRWDKDLNTRCSVCAQMSRLKTKGTANHITDSYFISLSWLLYLEGP